LDIRNPRQPVATGLVSTANAFALAQQDSFLFVADGAAGFTVIDLHAQATPKVIANRPTTALAQDVVVYQNHAYVAVGSSGMDVFDLADPAAPKFVTNYHVDGFTNHLNISGQRAYLANWETVEIVDISDPDSPQLVATQHALQRAMTVAVQDRIFYVGDWSTLRIYRYDDFPVPDINTDPLELSFGTVPVGQQQVLDLRIENLGLEPLQVKSISVTGAGFSVSSATFTLNRFESRTIPVTYAPLSQHRVSGFISIQSDDPDESQKIVPLIGGERTIGVGDSPADFTLQDTDGQTYHLQDFIQKKNVIVLAFYASW
ncbi:MAG: choice-of-anchor D domain-containing protein, partial [Calditrichaeota bacterium]